jgi:hypothetical protein
MTDQQPNRGDTVTVTNRKPEPPITLDRDQYHLELGTMFAIGVIFGMAIGLIVVGWML